MQDGLRIADQESLRDEEEAELKLLVKNVPKKLTYDQNEQVMLPTLPVQSLDSRNSEVQLRNVGQADEEEGVNAARQEGDAQADGRDVYYELSSSNNDATESEVEEDDPMQCIEAGEGEARPLERDEFAALRESLAENKNFLHSTPPGGDTFAAAK